MTRRGPGDRRGFAALLLLACLLGEIGRAHV